MAKIKYREQGFYTARRERLDKINIILAEYAAQGFTMTLRQLHYQMVSRNFYKNTKQNYGSLSALITDARECGYIDWDAIEDRGRTTELPYSVDGIADALQDTADQYRLNRMRGQPHYIEIWSEKDALSNVFTPICHKYHIRFLPVKGNGSTSTMHDAALRFKRQPVPGILIYLGDHDPSGLSMVGDIKNRMENIFRVPDIQVISPALNFRQVEYYKLPPNDVKEKDTRTPAYEAKFGPHCWELDALSPTVLTQIIETALGPFIDFDMYNSILEREETERDELEEIAERFK